MSVCLSVCPLAYLKTARPNVIECFMHAISGRDLILWRQYDRLCRPTSGFADDVVYPYNGRNGKRTVPPGQFPFGHFPLPCSVRVRV